MTGWQHVRLGNELELAYGRGLPAHTRESGPFAVFGSNGCVGHHTDAFVRGPGIIVGRKGSVGEVAFSREDFWPIDTTYYLINKNSHDWRYLFHLLSSLGLTRLNSHSAVPGLNREDVYSIEVKLPPKPEQKAIALALDTLEKSVAMEAEVIASTVRLKRVAMQTLFRSGLRGEVRKETTIGPMPKSWEPKTILDVCEIWSGGTPRKSVSEYWDGIIPWVSGKDLKAPILSDSVDHVTSSGVAAGSRLAPTDAVLMLVRGMGLAKDLPVAMIDRPMAFNQDVKALVSRGGYSGSFIRSAIYVGKDRLLSRIVPSAHGTMTLNLNDVETFAIPCPSDRAEADNIAAILDTIEQKAVLHRRKRAVLADIFSTLRYKLIFGEIPVSDLDLSALRSDASLQAAA